ncbi:hypothetical protein CsSME_00006451 [Camellia sinensis var. sinensis]
MCCGDAESVDQFLIHCPMASRLWVLVFSTFGVLWVQQKGVTQVLWIWGGNRVGKRQQKVWALAPLRLIWLLWLERNRRIFQEVTWSMSWLENSFLQVLCG